MHIGSFRGLAPLGFIIVALSATACPGQESLLVLSGHKGAVRAVKYSPDSRTIATAGEDGDVRLWDAATGKRSRTLSGHLGAVRAVAFSAHGKFLAAGSGTPRNTVYQLTHAGPKLLREEPGTGQVKVWDLESAREINTTKFDSCAVGQVVFQKGGKLLATGLCNGTLEWRDTQTWKRTKVFGRPLGAESALIDISADGKTALRAAEGSVTIFSTDREKERAFPQAGEILSVSAHYTCRIVASGTTEVRLWNMDTGEQAGEIKDFPGGVFALAFSPDGKILACVSHRQKDRNSVEAEIKLFKVSNRAEIAVIRCPGEIVECIEWSPNGKMLASGSSAGEVKVWRMTNGVAP